MPRSNVEWGPLIEKKIEDVLSDNSLLPSVYEPGSSISRLIDHTLLKPNATIQEIDVLCDEALKHQFKTCCVNGCYVRLVASRLYGSQTTPCAVIGFPLGANSTAVKVFEAQQAVQDGAGEIDMVINIGLLKAREHAMVYDDILQVVNAVDVRVPVKVILETALLSDEEKIVGSYIAAEAGAKFVKTCTGFGGGGATAADVALMKKTVRYKSDVKVKASGGIRTAERCIELLNAGADRIGTSSGVAIVEGMR